MDLTNESYRIRLGTRNFTERYYRDAKGWLKVSARGRKFRMTAEQVLNHLLPALAGLKPGLILEVEHRPRPHRPNRLMSADSRTKRSARPWVTRSIARPSTSEVVITEGKARIRSGVSRKSGFMRIRPSW